MSNALKDQFNQAWWSRWWQALQTEFGDLGVAEWLSDAQLEDWSELSLKQRIQYTSHLSYQRLEQAGFGYAEIVDGLQNIAPQFPGLPGLVLSQIVEEYGLADFDVSFKALETFTQFSTAEFAIRAFIEQNQTVTMAQMQAWSLSDNHHLRRLASEGCRPRLPWGKALTEFKRDPTPILPILQNLIHDPSLYVRKSVANNLNDIGKDHPEVLLAFCQAWLSTSTQADWIIKHASRNFLKQRDSRFLALLNLPKTDHVQLVDWQQDTQVKLGEAWHYHFELQTSKASKPLGRLRLEIQVDYPRPSGMPLRKVFKLAEADYSEARKEFNKTLSFKPLTTRRHYAGQHKIQLVINGEIKHQAWFEVKA
ncbi:DNA alkylation repair protein [Thiomicrospira pelophila]|uniref:DNA alkylation repair protein n=1 Tax=Thiomicrospira pelophila TaxID=934 RepID=UPI0004A76CFC|nr:DNA alkylation repair protein [Thiomicrospira pelophila]